MKEFIEKLIGRLEEKIEIWRKDVTSGVKQDGGYLSLDTSNKSGRIRGLLDAIEIVNQLAEEYNNESVKWDLISRSALMEALNKSDRDARTDADIQGYCDGWNDVVEIINEQPTAHNNGWIPCSERLPDVEADVLLSLRSLDVYTGFRANTEGCFYVEGEGYVEFENIIAWQPLPAPYQKGE